jgi:hypothetical protein
MEFVYRVVLHRDSLNTDQGEKLWQEFAAVKNK